MTTRGPIMQDRVRVLARPGRVIRLPERPLGKLAVTWIFPIETSNLGPGSDTERSTMSSAWQPCFTSLCVYRG